MVLRVCRWPRPKDSVSGPAGVCVVPVGVYPVTSQLFPSVPSSTWSLHLTASLHPPCHHCGAAVPSACCRLLSLPALSPRESEARRKPSQRIFPPPSEARVGCSMAVHTFATYQRLVFVNCVPGFILSFVSTQGDFIQL